MAKIVVDAEKCIGCGSCIGIAPEVFELVNGKSSVKADFDYDSLNEEAKQNVETSIASCPVQAITKEEAAEIQA
jgi:ferredoxin